MICDAKRHTDPKPRRELGSQALSSALCSLVEARLGVPAARTYIEFAGAEGYIWGWNGSTFG